MMPTRRGLLPFLFIISSGTVATEQVPPNPAPLPPVAAALAEARLEKYALCRERLDPVAIQAVLEAHGQIVRRIEASLDARPRSTMNRLEANPLPVYGDTVVEWLVDEGWREFDVEPGDPFTEASSSAPQAGPAAAQLQALAARCGLGSAAAYWETTRRIASVLDYEPERERSRPGSLQQDVRMSRRGQSKRFENLLSTTPAQNIATERALLDRFLGRLGLCTRSEPSGSTAAPRTVCWKGLAIAGAPCEAGLNRGSTGYFERDGIRFRPSGRPAGPRLKTVCSKANEVRSDLPAYPVFCYSGDWVHVVGCADNAGCHPEWDPTPRSCRQGLCYWRGSATPILR